MATQSPLSSANIAPALEAGLKTPVIGRTNEQLQTELDAAENAATALAQRYENPNWFNVAAGFFKPQLGGFTASLGSASQALGENLEQQRANVVPTYVARAQVGAYKGQMANRKTAADEFSAAQAAGFPEKDLPKLQARLASLGAADLAESVDKMLKGKQQTRSDVIQSAQTLQKIPGQTLPPGMIDILKGDFPAEAGKPAPEPGGVPPAAWTGGKLSPANIEFYQHRADLGDLSSADILRSYEAAQGIPPGAAPKPAAKEPSRFTLEQQNAINDSNAKEMQAINGPKVADIAGHDRQKFQDTSTLLGSTAKLINDPETAAGLGQLYKDQGFIAAVKKALAQGVQVSASGGILSGGISASLPVEDIMQKLDLSPSVQKKIRQVQLNLSQIEAQNLRESLASTGAGGHANVPEFTTAMTRVVTGSDPQEILKPFLAKEVVKNMRKYEHHNSFVDWQKANAGVPNYEYIRSPRYTSIADKFAPDLSRAYGAQ
jgi:hypothetical protein